MSNFFARLGLQFFADPAPEQGQDPTPEQQQQQTVTPPEKTFTQEEVNAVASREKKQGKAAVLRELGLDPEDKKAVENLKKLIEDSQTAEQRLSNQLQTEQGAKAEAEARAEAAETKLAAIQAGANPQFVDDLVVLARSKVSDAKPIAKVLEEMKTTHPMFYTAQEQQGTGGAHNPARRQGQNTQSIAERLTQQKQSAKQSAFFKHT